MSPSRVMHSIFRATKDLVMTCIPGRSLKTVLEMM
ncbi:hypothetical protein GBAR_LOCUS18263 [Geodia barretti]|uniref:Uncharacterized protein n=1 Tax=Geodia barretti TaxID=519541 RepID=A0AA35WZC8_GEOBA|nr:hypothetical protein GBAR_LOCUS18263 [Geodia barretti]